VFSVWTTPLFKSVVERFRKAPATKEAEALPKIREQKLKEGERARELAKQKAAAFVAMKTGKDLKTAAKWSRTSIPKSELEKAVQGLPEKAAFQLRMAATDPTGELKSRPGFIASAWNTLLRETSRFSGAAAGAFEALLERQIEAELEAAKKLSKKLGAMTPEEAKKKGYVILGEGFKPLPITTTTAPSKTSAEAEKPARKVSVIKSIVEGFKSPEKYDFQPMPKRLLEQEPEYKVLEETMPTLAKVYRLGLNLGLGIGLDPTMYVGIGKTAKVAPEAAKLAEDVRKAEEAGEQAKRLQESLKQVKRLQEKSKGVKATAKERVKAIGEEAKRAETELSKEVKKIEKLNKSLGESYVKLQREEQRAAKLAQDAHTEHWKAVVGISDVEMASKKKQLAEQAAQAVQEHKRAIEETQRAISQSSNRIEQLRAAQQMKLLNKEPWQMTQEEFKKYAVQRVEEPGVSRATFDKLHGIYTTPLEYESPHKALGGETYLWLRNPKAKVLRVDTGDLVRTNRGLVGQSAGIAALRKLLGKDADKLLAMSKPELIKILSTKYPQVDWGKYYDAQEILEGYAGLLAREAGYDAIYGIDKVSPEFTEYVGLTEKSMIPITSHREIIEQALAEGKPVPLRVLKDYPDLQAKVVSPVKEMADQDTARQMMGKRLFGGGVKTEPYGAIDREGRRVERLSEYSKRLMEREKTLRRELSGLLKEVSKAPELRRRLLLAQAPRTVLRVGSAEIPLDKVLYPAGEALLDVARSTRPTRAVANVLGKVFRYGQPKITPEMTYDKFRELSNLAEFVHGGVAKVSAGGRLEQAATAKKWAGAEIPKEIREKVPYYIETPDEEALKKLSPEARQLLDKAADIYRTSAEEMYQKLVEAFGADAPEYVENYVMHLYKERPEQAKEILTQWQKALGRKSMPGARPSFTKEREIETLKQAKAAGYKPVEDAAVLDAVYRRASTQLLLEKELTDTLESMGYIVKKGKKAPEGWIPGGPIVPWLKGKYVHPEVAEMLQLGRRSFEINDEVLNAALRLYDRALTTFKGVVTLRPMYHFMNFVGNMMLMRMAGVPTTKIPELYTRFLKVMAGKTEEDRKLLDTFRSLGLEGTGAFREIKSTQQMLKEAEEAVAKAEGGPIKGVIRFFIPTRALKSSRELGEFVDTWSRGAMFLHYLDEGFTTEQAASLVRKYLGDYSKLTGPERDALKRIFPFYAWVKFALPRSIASIVEHPGAFSEYRRVQEYMAQEAGADQSDLPDWLQGSIILKTDDDDRIVILNPQPPWADVYELLSDEGGQQALQQLLWMLTPAAATTHGMLTGRDLATGKYLVKDEVMQNHPLAARAVALLRYWLPRSELQQMRLGEILPALKPVEGILGLTPSTEPMVYQRAKPGLAAPFTAMINVYDKRLDEAKRAAQMSKDMSTILRRTVQDEGVMLKGIPEEKAKEIREAPNAEEAASVITSEMVKEVGYQNKAAVTRNAWQAATSDPVKSKVLAYMIQNSANPQMAAQNLVATCPQLWTLPPDKFRSVMGWLFSLPNIQKVAQRVGHIPSYQEMLSYAQPLAKEQLGIEKMKPKEPTTTERMRLEGVFDTTSIAAEVLRSRGYDRQLIGTNMTFSDVVSDAIRITGVGDDWVPYLWWLASRESSFNPYAVNASSGATGLMQTKPKTFNAYALPGMTDITNPLHNLVAAIRYIQDRYGHPSKIPAIGKTSSFTGY